MSSCSESSPILAMSAGKSSQTIFDEMRRPYSAKSDFTSKCCKKCRRRREKRLLRKLREYSRAQNSSLKKTPPSRSPSVSGEKERKQRSPSIPLDPNRTSPSHLEARRITSARKPPVPYVRKWTWDDSSSEGEYFTPARRS